MKHEAGSTPVKAQVIVSTIKVHGIRSVLLAISLRRSFTHPVTLVSYGDELLKIDTVDRGERSRLKFVYWNNGESVHVTETSIVNLEV